MPEIKEKAEAIINRIVEENGAYLVNFNVNYQGKRSFIKVVIQSLSGISMDEIAAITKIINSNEELDRLFEEGYFLEVSSPGVDAKLTEYRDFPRNVGRMLKIYHNSSALKSPVSGRLIEVTEEQLTLDIKGSPKTLRFDDLDYAKVEIKW